MADGPWYFLLLVSRCSYSDRHAFLWQRTLSADRRSCNSARHLFGHCIGLGSLAAGRLSGDHIELGLVPLGSIAIRICLGLVALSAPSYPLTAISLVLL